MGLVRWLDDLDTRVIGRGNPNWRSPTPDPWTPEIGPLSSVRAMRVPYAWALCTAGAISVAGFVAFPGDHSTLLTIIRLAWLPLAWVATRGLRSLRLVDDALPVPADMAIERPGAAHWVCAAILGVVLSVTILSVGANDNDVSSLYIPIAYILAAGVSMATHLRRLARWEDEHGVDLLRARWRTGSRGYYARPRSQVNGAQRLP